MKKWDEGVSICLALIAMTACSLFAQNDVVAITSENAGEIELLKVIDVGILIPELEWVSDSELAAVTSEGVVLWDVYSLEESTIMTPYEGQSSIDFSPDGRLLAADTYENTVKIVDTRTGTELAELEGHASPIRLWGTPDGKRLIVIDSNGNTILWNIPSGEIIRRMQVHQEPVIDMAIDSAGTMMVTSSIDGLTRLWDLDTGELIIEFRSAGYVVFSPNTDRLLMYRINGDLVSCSIDSLLEEGGSYQPEILLSHYVSASNLALSKDGSLIALGEENSNISLFDASTGAKIGTFSGHTARVTWVAFSPDGTFLASYAYNGDGKVRVWSIPLSL